MRDSASPFRLLALLRCLASSHSPRHPIQSRVSRPAFWLLGALTDARSALRRPSTFPSFLGLLCMAPPTPSPPQ